MHTERDEAREIVKRLRRVILEMATKAREGHIASSFSILEILYAELMVVQPGQEKTGKPRDVFILSKGHASIGLYSVLAEAGAFPHEWLDEFATYDSPLGGHPDATKVPGVHLSTGSLGHALAVGVGLAMGNRVVLTPQERPRIVVLIGDGEANEGSVWEAVALASHHNLHELLCIIDHNRSTDRALVMDSFEQKFRAFGWDVGAVNSGHDIELLVTELSRECGTRPSVLVVHTTKGKGITEMEGNPAWHHAFPTQEQLTDLVKSVKL